MNNSIEVNVVSDKGIHYFLCRLKDHYYRVGIDGDSAQAQQTFSEFYDSVEYIDEFADVISIDIDKESGIGNRYFKGEQGEFYVRTCKHIHQLITRKTKGDFWEILRKTHKKIKRTTAQQHHRKLEKEAKKLSTKQQ